MKISLLSLIVFIICLSNGLIESYAHKCIHGEIFKKNKVQHFPLTDKYCRFRKRCTRRMKKKNMFRKMRIKVVYNDINILGPE